jgi:glycosyltransferase involved in cell wall biosynthesis
MRICLVTKCYPFDRGGGMLFVTEDRAWSLAEMGHEVHVLTPYRRGRGVEMYHDQNPVPTWGRDAGGWPAGLRVHCLPGTSESWSAEFADSCRLFVEQAKPDLLHLDSFDRINPWFVNAPGRPTMRVGVTMHGFGPGAFLTEWNKFRAGNGPAPHFDANDLRAEASALSHADHVFAVSEHELWMLRDMYGLRQAQQVYNPIAPYFFTKPRKQHDRKGFILAAVSGAGNRGSDVALAAARDAGVELVVVSGRRRPDMVNVYDRIQALVLPTFYSQGFDLTVGEAMARGCPIIASETGSYYYLRWQPYCKLVKLGDVPELVEALKNPPTPPGPTAGTLHDPKRHAQKWLTAMTR